MERTYSAAPKGRRLGAFLLDGVLVFLFWYLLTSPDLARVNVLMITLDPVQAGALDAFAQAVMRLVVVFLLKLLFCQTVYFCLLPALFGRGRTLGKVLFRLAVVDEGSLAEPSPSRLVLREFVGRSLLETLLVLPGLVSGVLALFAPAGRTLRDRLSNTAVVADSGELYEEA